jgi:hypothetical protein
MSRAEESLLARIARLERALGSLLIFLAAQEIIGPEDFGRVWEELASHTREGETHHEKRRERRPQATGQPPA